MKKKGLVLGLILVMIVILFIVYGDVGGKSGSGDGSDGDKVLKIRTISALKSTDWAQISAIADMQIININVFEGLYGMNEASGGYYWELAKDVKLSDNQLVYTIILKDASFQNGDKVTADDVVYSYERVMSNRRFDYLTSMVDSIRAVDEKTFELTLKYPYSAIDHTFFSAKIMSKKEIEAQGSDFGTKPHKAGTGPYYVSDYSPATGVKLTAYDGYYRGTPDIKNVEYVLITEDSAAVIAYENGELDYLHDAPTAEWEALSKAAGKNSSMIKGNNIRMFTINWQSKSNKGVLANELVRKAIYYAVDKETVNKAATNGYGVVAQEYMPSEYVATSPRAADGGFELYEYDPARSKELLLQAGFTEAQLATGVPIGTLTTYGSATGEKAKQAQVIQANLAEVGLLCKVEVADVNLISPRLHAYDYDLSIYGDSGNFDYNNIRQMVHSESVGMDVVSYKANNTPFNWQRMEELLALGVSTSDVSDRVKYYTELWSIVQETATILPVIHMPVGVAWSNRINPGSLCPSYYHIYDFRWQ